MSTMDARIDAALASMPAPQGRYRRMSGSEIAAELRKLADAAEANNSAGLRLGRRALAAVRGEG